MDDITPPPPDRRAQWLITAAALLLVILVAFGLRASIGLRHPYLIHPDETSDYLEQGSRLLLGYGQKPWTYQDGMRSWLFPGLIAGAMRIGMLFGPGPDSRLAAVSLMMSALSLAPVICAFAWGRRVGGTGAAFLFGMIAAIWFELVYFSGHAMPEVLGTDLLVVGVCLCPDRRSPGGPMGLSAGRARAIGLMLGLAFSVRIQLAPAVAVTGLWLAWAAGRHTFLRAVLAGAMTVAAAGLLDLVTYGVPFKSFVMNVVANMSGVASFYGTVPVYWLLDREAFFVGPWLGVIVLCTVTGAWRLPLPLLIAITVTLVQSVIPHKEWRFLYPAIPFLLIVAATGTWQLAGLLAPHVPVPARLQRSAAVTTAGLLWAFASLWLGTQGNFRTEWQRSRGVLLATRLIAARSDVCGVGSWSPPSAMPGLSQIGHDVPIYSIDTPERLAEVGRFVNVLIGGDEAADPGHGYERVACFANGSFESSLNRRMPQACVWIRPGPCAPGGVSDPQQRPPGW